MTQPYKAVEPNKDQVYMWELIHEVFVAQKSGQLLLEKFKKIFFESPVSPPGCAEGFGYFREGQNDFVRYICKAIIDYSKYKHARKL